MPARGARPGVPIGKGSRRREAVRIAVSAPTAPSLFRAESGRRRVPAFVWEIAIAVAAYLVYEGARFVAVGSYPTALAHAHQVVALEQHLHLDVEGGVQDAFLGSPLLTVLNYVYLAAQNQAQLVILIDQSFLDCLMTRISLADLVQESCLPLAQGSALRGRASITL